MAKNTVTAGDYRNRAIEMNWRGKVYIRNGLFGFGKKIFLNRDTVASYEVVGEESRTSATSAVARGAIGAALLGPVGIAAALSARKKGIHTVAVQFKDGKRSMIEVDGKIFVELTRLLF